MAREIKLPLPPADDLFSTQEERDDAQREKVIDIPIAEIDGFPDHPFFVKMDESMQAMAESVKTFGVQTPAVVRQKEDGRYELISGHRRKMACEIAGIEVLPCIVRQLSRDESIIAMVDSNLQREVILPSEKAKSYKMRLDAMKRKVGRPSKENVSPVGTNLRSDEQLSQMSGDSRNQIHRYIRLTDLIPELLDMVDENKIAMRPAVELSYLPKNEQQTLLAAIESEDCTPSHVQAAKMRKFSQDGRLSEDVIFSIMQEEKPNQVEQFKMPKERISKYFAPGTPVKTMEDTIVAAMKMYREREQKQKQQRDSR
jgi:ParB family chromosome partitioning protein